LTQETIYHVKTRSVVDADTSKVTLILLYFTVAPLLGVKYIFFVKKSKITENRVVVSIFQ